MQNVIVEALKFSRRARGVVCLLTVCSLMPTTRVRAVEDPPGCSLEHGGGGNTSAGGLNFNLGAAHVGDTVPVFPTLGMTTNACRAINVTGTVYVATGPLTNFLVNVTLDPGTLVVCPTDARCQPGPYNITITPAMVGAAVNTPLGSASGVPRIVRAVENGFGDVLASDFADQLSDFHTASILIVSPCIQVFKTCELPAGQNCFLPETPVRFRGYVTNCGDITLTNVAVVDNRAGQLQLFNPTNGQALTGNVILPVGGYAVFTNSFLPTLVETCGGSATNTVTATARDTTTIGGPNAAVTNSFTDVCPICSTPTPAITMQCEPGLNEPGGLLTYSGSLSNRGNVILSGVLVVSDQPAPGTPVVGPISLNPGAVFNFTNSYTVPLDSCGPYPSTLTVQASTDCGVTLTNSASAICSSTNSPAIHVVKVCPAGPVEPGQLMIVTGMVTNTGNITLTNVVVTNTISALGNESRSVLGPIRLAPGEGMGFTDSYLVPLDSCGSYSDTLTASGADKCFGREVSHSDTKACPGTNSPSLIVTKSCPADPVEPGQVLTVTGTVTNTGNITLTNVVVTNTIAALGNESRQVLGPITLAPGAGATFSDSYTVPLDSCAPYSDTFAASGADVCFGRVVTHSDTRGCRGTNSPSLVVTKACPVEPVQPGQLLTVTGTVTNTGNITLTNVVVTNTISALGNLSRQVLGPITLAPGAGAGFSDSYTVPLDSCGSYLDTFTASGADACFSRVVTHSDSKACSGTNSPSLTVTKVCPPGLVQPGQVLTVSGTVTNTGNITLTNVVVTNTIAALGNASRRVLGPISLAPGSGMNFSDSYVVPLDSCGPYTDTFMASGADKCFGRVATHSASRSCPGTNSPSITVRKFCPPIATPPGQLTVISGVVSNSGNISLTNVIVFDNQPDEDTVVLGPIVLAPGQAVTFSNSYVVPANFCIYVDTVRATGRDQCFGRTVSHTFTAVCPTATTPRLTVTRDCPPAAVPLGQQQVYSGVVSNSGNITLTNVLVVNSQPSNNSPVIGPITLSPGERVFFTGSYPIPLDICETNILDTVSARGNNICDGVLATASQSGLCPILPQPLLVVTKRCPVNPVSPGGLITCSGTVSNGGTVTLTNVLVINDHPTNNTPVFGPVTLAPGQSTNFTSIYRVCTDCCPPFVDTFTATAAQMCDGSAVAAFASASCPGVTSPRVTLRVLCPPATALGELVFYSGTVSNSGDVLTSVLISDNQSGPLLDIPALATAETVEFSSFYLATNCGPDTSTLVTATASDLCTGVTVTNQVSTGCYILCPTIEPPVLLNPKVSGGQFTFSFATEASRHYKVQYTDNVVPANWQTLADFVGSGGIVTITDPATNPHRFYRVLVQ